MKTENKYKRSVNISVCKKKKIIKENKQLQVNKFLSKTHNIKVAKREFNLFYGSPYKTSDKLKKMLARPNLPHS